MPGVGTNAVEDAMTTDDGKIAVSPGIPVPERYRAVILAGLGLLSAVLLQIADLGVDGRPLGGIEAVNILLGAVVLAAVYFPGSAWVKLSSGVAGALLQTIASAWTDAAVTGAEWVTIGATAVTAVMVGAFPNAPQLVVGERGDDEPEAPEGTTYLPPSQRKDGGL
jgi:hypothetical protein